MYALYTGTLKLPIYMTATPIYELLFKSSSSRLIQHTNYYFVKMATFDGCYKLESSDGLASGFAAMGKNNFMILMNQLDSKPDINKYLLYRHT